MSLLNTAPALLLLLATVIHSCLAGPCRAADKPLASYVDPFLGTTAPSGIREIGFNPPWQVWGGLTFPGASLPNAMVQLSPVTQFKSGSGYEYKHDTILGFAHTNKGHWDYCHIPVMPVAGGVRPDDFGSSFSHKNESASPGYYQVFLKRYKINAELTTTLRCGYHRYTYKDNRDKKLVVNLAMSNEHVDGWKINRAGDNAFHGFQQGREKVFFHAVANRSIKDIEIMKGDTNDVPVVLFEGGGDSLLEIKIGLSFVSVENAKMNLDAELAGKDFDTVRSDASACWEALLSKIQITGGTDRQRGMFYSCLYRSFMWPALRGDVNGQFRDQSGNVARKNFTYYTTPSLWDDYRNKLVLLTMLAPELTGNVIQSMVCRGQTTGFMPTFFHGDHAAPFIAGAYLRGLRGFDVEGACALLVKNATVENKRARPHLAEYIASGYVSTPPEHNPHVETRSTAGVTKTLEYAYDDYAVALLARALKDERTYHAMMERSRNYANVFDKTSGLMRGRLKNGAWVRPFDPRQPYYEYMYREANAWQSSFFAPHDTEGLIRLYSGANEFEKQLDRLFTVPWNPKHMARNVNTFIGQYCHGNQPDHGFPYLYYWVGRQEKSQVILNKIMHDFYGMHDGRTLCGMDDAGEMSSWYVFNAIGLYPYSPADPNYIITVPLFNRIEIKLNEKNVMIVRENTGIKIKEITCDGKELPRYFVSHQELLRSKTLLIRVAPLVLSK
jgi:predicted alpha-1,2-mannosidase